MKFKMSFVIVCVVVLLASAGRSNAQTGCLDLPMSIYEDCPNGNHTLTLPRWFCYESCRNYDIFPIEAGSLSCSCPISSEMIRIFENKFKYCKYTLQTHSCDSKSVIYQCPLQLPDAKKYKGKKELHLTGVRATWKGFKTLLFENIKESLLSQRAIATGCAFEPIMSKRPIQVGDHFQVETKFEHSADSERWLVEILHPVNLIILVVILFFPALFVLMGWPFIFLFGMSIQFVYAMVFLMATWFVWQDLKHPFGRFLYSYVAWFLVCLMLFTSFAVFTPTLEFLTLRSCLSLTVAFVLAGAATFLTYRLIPSLYGDKNKKKKRKTQKDNEQVDSEAIESKTKSKSKSKKKGKLKSKASGHESNSSSVSSDDDDGAGSGWSSSDIEIVDAKRKKKDDDDEDDEPKDKVSDDKQRSQKPNKSKSLAITDGSPRRRKPLNKN